MKDRGIVKVCQVGHVLAFFILWRVQLLENVLLERFLLSQCKTSIETPEIDMINRSLLYRKIMKMKLIRNGDHMSDGEEQDKNNPSA